jgi:hypothetical protein
MPFISIWYAMDWKRHTKHHNSCVIEVEHDPIRKAFTLIDENALAILKKACEDVSNNVIIKD